MALNVDEGDVEKY